MKFGVFYEHQLPRPWTENSEYQLMQDSLRDCRKIKFLTFGSMRIFIYR